MKLAIEDIIVTSRIRKQVGDLSELKQSIQEVGLLSPIIVNEKHELLSGFRRLEACRQLGLTEIEVRVLDTGENDVKKLDIEYHENLGRLDLTTEDQQIYAQTRHELLNPPRSKRSMWGWLKRLWQFFISLFRRGKKDATT